MTEVRKFNILKKKIRYLFVIMKKINFSNQQKIIKYIEKHIIGIKKFINHWRNSQIYKISKKYINAIHSKRKDLLNIDKYIEYNENLPTLPDQESQYDEINVSSIDFESKLNSSDNQSILDVEHCESTSNIIDDCDDDNNDNDNAVSECEQNFEREDLVDEVKAKKQSCIICKETFTMHELLIDHIFKHDGTPQSCLRCKSFFKNAASFQFHYSKNDSGLCFMIEKENYKYISLKDLLFCPYCGKKFSKCFNLKRHIQSCDFLEGNVNLSERIYTCDLCPWRSCSKDNYARHYLKHAKHHCHKCNISFSSRKLLREHNANHQQPAQYHCEVCRESFVNRRLYREHMKTFKNDPKHKQNVSINGCNKIWCKPCQKSFIDEKTYKRHCSRQNHLKTSKQDISGIRTLICDKCGLTFINKEGLTDHITNMHKMKEKLICEFCPYTTAKSSNMVRHRKFRHKNAPKEHACDKCPILFSSLSNLKDHIQAIHSNDRPYLCGICGKAFKLQSQLNRHKVTHDSVLQYPCTYCTMGFKRRSHLKRHMVSKHEDFLPNSSEFKINKKIKPLQQEPSTSHMSTLQDDQMFSLLDVQSGELVLLSVKDISKNNVINLSSEEDLLNGVHMSDGWTNPGNGLYCMDPILGDDRNPQAAYMLPPDGGNPQVIADPNYVHYSQPVKDMEMLTNNYGIVKDNILPQNGMNPELIVTDPNCNSCLLAQWS